MNELLSYITSVNLSNYNVYNTNNIFNFLISTMNRLPKEEKTLFIDTMRIQIGNTFTNNFKVYIFTKLKNSDLLNYF